MRDLFGETVNLKPKANIKLIAEKFKAVDEYEDWLSVLKKKKAATTQCAWKRRLNRVIVLLESGENIADVFAQSADSGWTGLFEVRGPQQKTNGVPRDETACIKFAADLNIHPKPGESMSKFRGRVESSIGH